MLQIAGLGIGVVIHGEFAWNKPHRLVMDAVQLGADLLGRGFYEHMNHQWPILQSYLFVDHGIKLCENQCKIT